MIDSGKILVPIGFPVYLTLPDNKHTPAKTLQLLCHALIPFFVALYFCLPEVDVASRHPETGTAFMPVPETSVDKNHRPVLWEHHIRMSGKTSVILPVPESHVKQILPYKDLRLGVLSVNLGHVVMALLRRKFIHLYEWYTRQFFRQTIQMLSIICKCNRKKSEILHFS